MPFSTKSIITDLKMFSAFIWDNSGLIFSVETITVKQSQVEFQNKYLEKYSSGTIVLV